MASLGQPLVPTRQHAVLSASASKLWTWLESQVGLEQPPSTPAYEHTHMHTQLHPAAVHMLQGKCTGAFGLARSFPAVTLHHLLSRSHKNDKTDR